MAKITGLSGMIQGKVGPTVYRVSRGVQVASQYNPNPANPRSPAQTNQRSVFGSGVQLAKSVYDDAVLGPLFKSVQYKQRTNLISKILNNVRLIVPVPDKPGLTAIDSLTENWIPGFEEVLITANEEATNLEISISPADDGAIPSIAGAIVVCSARAVPGMSLDDMMVYGVTDHPVSQAKVYWFDEVVAPGEMNRLMVPLEDFEYTSPIAPKFVMPKIGQGREGFDDLVDAEYIRCWFVIPLSYDYDGFGLRLTIDDQLVTVGKMQILWTEA